MPEEKPTEKTKAGSPSKKQSADQTSQPTRPTQPVELEKGFVHNPAPVVNVAKPTASPTPPKPSQGGAGEGQTPQSTTGDGKAGTAESSGGKGEGK